jgi:hypothetical protein
MTSLWEKQAASRVQKPSSDADKPAAAPKPAPATNTAKKAKKAAKKR